LNMTMIVIRWRRGRRRGRIQKHRCLR